MMKKEKNQCPLLKDPDLYVPDTLDLLNNIEARNYWLPCLKQMVQNFTSKASFLNPEDLTAAKRAEISGQQFCDLLEKITNDPEYFKPLSIRTLLEYNEETLRAAHFEDAWSIQKEKETCAAFSQFNERNEYIDSITDFYTKWVELAKGFIAGNMFDWGAKAITDMLQENNGFGLAQAMLKIQKRPWFHDDLDKWVNRIKSKSYNVAVVFIDNAGIDFVLGVLPFARQLLKQGTRVILTANTAPALNDVTYHDLKLYLNKAAQKCPIIKEAISVNKLIGIENGQKGPCLDMCNLNTELCRLMVDADLLVLEGMGRAIHTNLKAKFKVDCLKVAVIKNEWLARNLGAEQFAVIFEYDPAAEQNSPS